MSLFKKKSNQEKVNAEKTMKWGIAAGVAQAIYIGLVALFMNQINELGNQPLGGFLTSFMFFLLFFVLSAVVSGILVFGKPIFLILNGKNKEAVSTLLATVLVLLVITFLVFVVILL